MPGSRRRLLAWLGQRPGLQAWALIAPAGLWLLLFFLVPVLLMPCQRSCGDSCEWVVEFWSLRWQHHQH